MPGIPDQWRATNTTDPTTDAFFSCENMPVLGRHAATSDQGLETRDGEYCEIGVRCYGQPLNCEQFVRCGKDSDGKPV